MESKNIDMLIQKYYDNYDRYVTVPDNISYGIDRAMYNNKMNKVIILIKKIIITILGICTLTGGLVFAKEYIFKNFNLGKGVDTAVENGYIYTPEKKVNDDERINGTGIQVYIEDFLMDDQNISTNFSFKFSDELLKKLNIEKIKRIELKDLILTDENNVILYCANEKALNEFCKNNNLNYKFSEFNENYFACGLNSFLQPNSSNDMVGLTYNIYLGDLENNYPKSKKLKYKFNEIALIENEEDNSNKKIMEGNWEINIEIPEKMYNRKNISYKVVECSNDNVEVTTAKVSDTGFEFGCIIRNVELPEDLRKLKEEIKDVSNKKISDEEKEKLTLKYRESDLAMPPINSNYNLDRGETIEDCSYIENQNYEKFLISTNPGRIQKEEFISNDTTFVLYETFDLTKYNITDELTVHLKFYNESISVKLRRNI